ncbi:hypothetical protein QYE76_009976 [Lolium multiflorum]|uniref:DNA-directed RNA polymerase subunit n=1 Tax=Lolium multiflorum TaxID=4521 RepID=A0AAD8TWB8_LOLMU|nr:hypothetical protein QYE76_009976 [Lolium multiflorum]
MVFHEAEMSWNVLISPDQMSPKGMLLRKSIIERLLEDIKCRKASEEHGYYIAVNELNAIAEGEVCELTGDVSFPVTFTCLTQKPRKGETFFFPSDPPGVDFHYLFADNEKQHTGIQHSVIPRTAGEGGGGDAA